MCFNPDPIKVQLLYISNEMARNFKAPSSIKFVTSLLKELFRMELLIKSKNLNSGNSTNTDSNSYVKKGKI